MRGELIVEPEPEVKSVVRSAQIMRLVAYMTENNASVAQACRDLGFNARTMKRWLAKEENKSLIQQIQKAEMEGAIQSIVSAWNGIIEEQIDIALRARAPEDRTRSARFLEHIMESYSKLQPNESENRITVKFNPSFILQGPVTRQADSTPRSEDDK